MGKQAIFCVLLYEGKRITPPVHVDMNWGRGISRQRDLLNLQNRIYLLFLVSSCVIPHFLQARR